MKIFQTTGAIVLMLLLPLAGLSANDTLPAAYYGFWFDAYNHNAAYYFDKDYFKIRDHQGVLADLWDYATISKSGNQFRITGKLTKKRSIKSKFELIQDTLYLLIKDKEPLKYYRKPPTNSQEIISLFNKTVAPEVNQSYEQIFDKRKWQSPDKIRTQINTAWNFKYQSSSWDRIAIAEDYLFYLNIIWRYKQAIFLEDKAILEIQNVSNGKSRYLFWMKPEKTILKVYDLNKEHLIEFTHKVLRYKENMPSIHWSRRGRYFSLFKSVLNSPWKYIRIGKKSVTFQGKSWKTIKVLPFGERTTILFRHRNEIQSIDASFGRARKYIVNAAITNKQSEYFKPSIANGLMRSTSFAHLMVFVILLVFICLLLLPLILLLRLKRNRKMLNLLQLTVLKTQLNPHFIFNSLNSIQSLINQNKIQNANLYLNSFSKLMRSFLERSAEVTIPIAEEIELIENYCKLEALRFDFKYEIVIDPNVDLQIGEIPAGLIQPLIENSIKHGLVYADDPELLVLIEKEKRSLAITVKDNGPGIIKSYRRGKGIIITEKRIKALSKYWKTKIKFQIRNIHELIPKNVMVQEQGTISTITIKKYF